MESFDNAGLESMTVTLFEQAATEDVKHIEEIVLRLVKKNQVLML